jgi:hypothetical protein
MPRRLSKIIVMKKIFQTLAPSVFLIVITGAFSKNMEYSVVQFITVIVAFSIIYNTLVFLKKEKSVIYVTCLLTIIISLYSFIESVFYKGVFFAFIIIFFWIFTKKYLNNFKHFSR